MTNAVIDKLIDTIQSDGKGVGGYNNIIQFTFTDTKETAFVKFTGDNAEVITDVESASCNVLITTKNFEKLIEGNLNPQMAFMTGKIKAKGDMTQLLKLSNILSYYNNK
ncbi:MAG: SCP2 sterol-binding domain-containing protein [Lysinibacillus sp.]|nr:SCP2 sterol-binding domain-containing protein [Lysinibacillus sp.]